MDKIPFFKMHGSGNDYLFLDCRSDALPANPTALAVRMSRRHEGVGSDGLVLLLRSDCADVRMRMYNADGSEGQICGNALRCIGQLLAAERQPLLPLTERAGETQTFCPSAGATECVGEPQPLRLSVETEAGVRRLCVRSDGRITVDMGRADFSPQAVGLRRAEPLVRTPIRAAGWVFEVTALSVGNPHAVVFLPPTERNREEDSSFFERAGASIEHHPVFLQGANVMFVEDAAPRALRMRIWERGSGATLACGSGACAAVAAAVRLGYTDADAAVTVTMPGGAVEVRCAGDGSLSLTGTAALICRGEYYDG